VKQRNELRRQFHVLYVRVLKNKLYLEANFDKLQKVRKQMQAAAAKAQKGKRPSTTP
jgi:hypothetical protein